MDNAMQERDLLIPSRLIDSTREPDPIAWAVPDFAAFGHLTVLAGVAGIGKSQLSLWMAGQAGAAGIEALYLDAENGPDHLVRLERAMALAPRQVRLVDMASVQLSDPETLGQLSCEIQARSFAALALRGVFRGPLLVVDSLRRFAPGLSENSSDDMAPYVAGLQGLARDAKAAVVLIHHASGKADAPSMRGSSAILDQCDMAFTLSRRGDRLRVAVADGKFRLGPEPAPVWLRRVQDPLRFVAVDGPAPVGTKRDALAERLAELGPSVPAEGMKLAAVGQTLALDMTAGSADRKSLERALDEEGWRRVGYGQYAPPA